jgi:small subunit ribosomal protein S6
MARLQSLRDKPNTAREYETTYILRPNTPNEGVAEVNARIRGVIEGMGGKVIKVDNWGKRRLAYEVAKERKGIYLYWQYLAQPGVVEETERNLRMLDSVIRYLTVKVDEDIDVSARPSEIDDSSYEKAAQTAADEEDLFLSRGSDDVSSDDDDEFGGDDFEDIPAVEPAVPGPAPVPEKE